MLEKLAEASLDDERQALAEALEAVRRQPPPKHWRGSVGMATASCTVSSPVTLASVFVSSKGGAGQVSGAVGASSGPARSGAPPTPSST